jgi:glycosyltransferase involved in cell wall biosynthesis
VHEGLIVHPTQLRNPLKVAAYPSSDTARIGCVVLSMSRISISLVICTRNRAQQLKTCLAYIAALNTSIPWELIVVDNGSSDSTPQALREFGRSASFPLIVLNEPLPGLGRARNLGWRAARGEIIAFTDDDCYVLPDFLDRVLEAFADPKMGYCGGRVNLYDSSDYPITINESAVPEFFPPNNYFATGVIHGANMMFRRAALVDIGGFDNCFGAGARFLSGEDSDACTRASLAGWWGAYAPGPTVLHAHGRKAADVVILRRNYDIGDGAYAAKFILRRHTRWLFARRWGAYLAMTWRRSGGRRECLSQIEGAVRYCFYKVSMTLWTDSKGH